MELTDTNISYLDKIQQNNVYKLDNVNNNFVASAKNKLIKYMYDFNTKYNMSHETVFLTLMNISRLNYYDSNVGITLYCMALNIVANISIVIAEISAIMKDFDNSIEEITGKQIIELQMKILQDLKWDIDPKTIFDDIVKLNVNNAPQQKKYIELALLACLTDGFGDKDLINIIDTVLQVYYSGEADKYKLLSDKGLIFYGYLKEIHNGSCIIDSDSKNIVDANTFYNLFKKLADLY
jgi:hypothetical protein